MKKKRTPQLGEVIFGSSDKALANEISKLNKLGKIRKIAPRLYSSNLVDNVEDIIRRNLPTILANLYPQAVLSHRSAFEYEPTKTGHIFITYIYTKKIKLGDITIQLLEGHKALDGDYLYFGLSVSQRERAFLENLQESKNIGSTSKTLPLPELEEKLEEILKVRGEEELNKLRDKAREIAAALGLEKEFVLLNKLISTLLTTHDSKILSSPLATARALGIPYDPARLELFGKVFRILQAKEFPVYPNKNSSKLSFRNFAFFESYFSNYIEGTIFAIAEAKEIIKTKKPIPTRNEDSHDVLGTYQIVSDLQEMSKIPQTAAEFVSILQYRHKTLLSSRIDKNPGVFKNKNNYAGQTSFVDFSLVEGTLIKSFGFYQALTQPFARAAYIMFVISEVHPFLDGNGRIARVMMNAELVAANQSKIIIPTVFREDYMLALKKLSRQQDAEPYIKMLQRAMKFSATIYDENMDDMQQQLELSNAFLESSDGYLKIIERK